MKRLNGFSLMEMMVVLAIVAIVAAASAPMINKKMVRASGDDSPWKYANGGGTSIGYNFDSEGRETKTASIGVLRAPAGINNARLYIDTQSDATPHIAFGIRSGNIFKLIAGGDNNNIWLSNQTPGNSSNTVVLGQGATSSSSNSIAIGRGAQASSGSNSCVIIGSGASGSNYTQVVIGNDASSTQVRTVVIGNEAKIQSGGEESIAIGAKTAVSNGAYSIALGYDSATKATSSIALGYSAKSNAANSIAIGQSTKANGANSIAIGNSANAASTNSIALGGTASGTNSIAIGYGATAGANTITLGNTNHIVSIPGTLRISNLTITGNLVVEGDTLLGGTKGSKTYIRETDGQWIYNFRQCANRVDRQGNRSSITAFDMRASSPVSINGKNYTHDGNSGAIDDGDDNALDPATQSKITELENKIKTLETKNATLETKLSRLEARVSKLDHNGLW